MSFFLSTLLLLAYSSSTAASSDVASSALDAHVQEIVGWVRNQGGFFNDKLQIRRADPTDPTSYFGVFATEDIQPMEELMRIPESATIWAEKPDDEPDGNKLLCDLAHVLMKELKLGDKSDFAPFIKYLLEQERGQLPATWTEVGRELISELVAGPDRDDLKMTNWIKENFEDASCIEPGNAFEQQAVALVVQRGWDNVLIPIYDMINHINDLRKLNTDNTSVYEDGMNVWASRAIEAGEEIFASYDDCKDCGNIVEEWGTAEILRDFGFVEPYPHTFFFKEAEALFSVYKVTNYNEDGEANHRLEISWIDESPSGEDLDWMNEEYQRLQDLQYEATLANRRHLMPEKEWNTIFQYHQALTEALGAAIDDLEDDDDDEDFHYTEDDDTCYIIDDDEDDDEDDNEDDDEDDDEDEDDEDNFWNQVAVDKDDDIRDSDNDDCGVFSRNKNASAIQEATDR